ncbi:MAG: HD domain-containing protein, partial [Victivallales bacterium]|nr:HD domain-containing protein [Victivallales bacterium]
MSSFVPDAMSVIAFFYPEDDDFRKMLIKHSAQVRNKALEILDAMEEPIPEISRDELSAAAMLQDIGKGSCQAPSILSSGTQPYLAHGLNGGGRRR